MPSDKASDKAAAATHAPDAPTREDLHLQGVLRYMPILDHPGQEPGASKVAKGVDKAAASMARALCAALPDGPRRNKALRHLTLILIQTSTGLQETGPNPHPPSPDA